MVLYPFQQRYEKLSCARTLYQDISKLRLMGHRNIRKTRYLLLKIKVLCVFRFNNCTLTVDHVFQKINRCYFYSNLPRARVRKKTSNTDDQLHTMARRPPGRGGNPKPLASCIMNLFFARTDHRPRRIGICGCPQRWACGTINGYKWVHERRRRVPACGIGSSVDGTHVLYDFFLTGLTYA